MCHLVHIMEFEECLAFSQWYSCSSLCVGSLGMDIFKCFRQPDFEFYLFDSLQNMEDEKKWWHLNKLILQNYDKVVRRHSSKRRVLLLKFHHIFTSSKTHMRNLQLIGDGRNKRVRPPRKRGQCKAMFPQNARAGIGYDNCVTTNTTPPSFDNCRLKLVENQNCYVGEQQNLMSWQIEAERTTGLTMKCGSNFKRKRECANFFVVLILLFQNC